MGSTFPFSGGGVDAVEGVFGDVAVTCEGEITLFGPAGSRTVRAGDFFTGALSTLAEGLSPRLRVYFLTTPNDRAILVQGGSSAIGKAGSATG